MNPIRLSLPLVLAAVPTLFGASKEMVQLQRDVAQLQEAVRVLQSGFDTKMTELRVIVQQVLDESKRASTAVSVLDSGIKERMREQEKLVAAPVAGVGTKVDQLTGEFGTLREAVMDLSTRLTKMQSQLGDLKNVVTTMQAPAPAVQPPAPVTPPPQQLFESALKDKTGGNFALSLQQFQEFLKAYPTTDLAASAQFYIGEIYYQQNEYDNAVIAFDQVLERFPDNPKTPDATYMKGVALLKSGQKGLARKMFEDVVRKFPNSEVAGRARGQLDLMKAPATSSVPMRKKTRAR